MDHHIYYARYSVANHFDWLQNYSRSPCHIQGFARLASGGVVFNYNRIGGDGVFGVGRDCYPLILRFSPNNHKFSPVLLWTDYTNSDYRHYAYVPMDRLDNRGRQWHSGGMQAIGDYLAMPIDEAEKGPSRIVILDMTKNPPRLVHNLQLNNKPRPTRAEAVAITQMADGRFLLIAGQKQGRHAVAWRSTGTDMERTKWNLIDNSITIYYGNILGGKFNFNNLALVQAQPDRWNRPVAGKQQTYLLGLSNYPARTGGNTESDDTSVIVPYRVNIVYNRFTKREEVAIVQPHKSMEDGWMYRKAYKLDEGCGFFDVCPNFGAGGTVHVRGPYAMTVYATEHWPHGDDLDRLEWESKTKSYSTGSDPGGGDDGCRFCF